MIELNAGLSAVVEALGFLDSLGYRRGVAVSKVQAPDGIVVELDDGSRWSIMGTRQRTT